MNKKAKRSEADVIKKQALERLKKNQYSGWGSERAATQADLVQLGELVEDIRVFLVHHFERGRK